MDTRNVQEAGVSLGSRQPTAYNPFSGHFFVHLTFSGHIFCHLTLRSNPN